MKCYLAGPIESDNNFGKTWRRRVVPLLEELGIITIDPTAEEDEYLHKNLRLLNTDQMFTVMREIVDRDIALVKESDFVILRYSGVETVGSYHELGLAYELNKPIILYSTVEYHKLPAWLIGVFSINDVATSLTKLKHLIKTRLTVEL